MRLIGIVGSGATTSKAPLIVNEEVEQLAKEEQLVVIDDGSRGIKYLGVLREVQRLEPFLTSWRRTSFVDNPNLVESGILPYSRASVFIIGVLSPLGELSEPQLPPNPGSKVFVIESPKDLTLNLGLAESIMVGTHKYSGIEIPLRSDALPYHIAVVGTTGSGKSRLVKVLIDEILSRTDYSVIVFDHTGMDYVPFYEVKYVIKARDVVLEPTLIASLISSRCGYDDREGYLLLSAIIYILNYLASLSENVISDVVDFESTAGTGARTTLVSTRTQPRRLGNFNVESLMKLRIDFDKLYDYMAKYPIKWNIHVFKDILSKVTKELNARGSTKVKLQVAVSIKAGTPLFESLSGRNIHPRNIVLKAFKDKLCVVDLSGEDHLVKKFIITSVLNELWKSIESEGKAVKTVVVIDEAHNYACRYCGESLKAIARTVREGRKWGLGLILATQRIMDMDPEVRNNLNTLFFSKLQTPTDFNELRGYMDLAGISEASLAILGKREFFVAGLMNPLKIPILIKVKEVKI